MIKPARVCWCRGFVVVCDATTPRSALGHLWLMDVKCVLFMICAVMVLHSPTALSNAASVNTDCTKWTTGAAVAIQVDGVVDFGPLCNPYLAGTRLTFYASAGSNLSFTGWVARGGYAQFHGPTTAPYSVVNVRVAIVDSVFAAVDGAAFGVVLGVGYAAVTPQPTEVAAVNVTLSSINSTLSSTASTTAIAAVLGFAVSSTDLATALRGVAVVAIGSVLSADASGSPQAATAACVAGMALLSSPGAVLLDTTATSAAAAIGVAHTSVADGPNHPLRCWLKRDKSLL